MMRNRVITATLLLLVMMSTASIMVYAQDTNSTDTNGTLPLPDPTNSTDTNGTIPLPDPSNSTDTNTTEPIDDVNGTVIDPAILALIREQAHNRTQEMLLLFGNTTLPPSIANGFQHAMQAMEQAEAFESINSRAAAQQYLRAMKQYRNALRKYLKDNPEGLEVFEESEGNSTAPEPVNGTSTEEINGAKLELLERFEERFRGQISAMHDNVLNMSSDMSSGDMLKAQSALTKAEEKLLRIQERISAGLFDDAVDDLDNATETLDDDLGNMTDPGTAQMLRTINKLEAKIAKMADKAERMAAKGQDTSDLDAAIVNARGNKNKTKDDWKANNGNSGNSGNSGNQGKGKNKNKGNQGNGKGNN